jgi:hypothetical protein
LLIVRITGWLFAKWEITSASIVHASKYLLSQRALQKSISANLEYGRLRFRYTFIIKDYLKLIFEMGTAVYPFLFFNQLSSCFFLYFSFRCTNNKEIIVRMVRTIIIVCVCVCVCVSEGGCMCTCNLLNIFQIKRI